MPINTNKSAVVNREIIASRLWQTRTVEWQNSDVCPQPNVHLSKDICIVYDQEICSLFDCWIDLRIGIKYEIKNKVNFAVCR